MSEIFPFKTHIEKLEKKDFLRFSGSYSHIVSDAIPAVASVVFVEDSTPFTKIFKNANFIKKVTGVFDNMKNGGKLATVVGDTILLGFQLGHNAFIAAVIPKVDSVLLERVADDWLFDVRESIELEFLEVKKQFQDPETGLLNSLHLFRALEDGGDADIGLLLVELVLPRRMKGDAFRNVQQAAAALSVYSDSRILLHHLGQSVFAMLVKGNAGFVFEHLSSGLVQHLKKEGFSKVHIGTIRSQEMLPDLGDDTASCGSMLDNAWTALKAAARRGPFSFCDYTRLMFSDIHPLRPASNTVLRKLQRISKRDRRFCLIKLSPLPRDIDVTDVLTMVGGDGVYCIIDDDTSVFLYLSGYGPDEAMDYAEELLNRIRVVEGVEGVYGGITSYPYSDFNRSETLRNVQKALLHAAFFGPGHMVLFEALSLNVSGDVYFSDGDLPKAVAEYKRGLVCDCNDINLLNSLGVAYALLNRNVLARQTFERVLEIDERDYMALYNLGLGAQQHGNSEEAIRYFESAGQYCDESEESLHVQKDLTLQLGLLYCSVGRYQDSLIALRQWQQQVPVVQHSKVFRYLGEAYLGTGEGKEAMVWLQRALQHNEFDAEAMGLLGTAISDQGEGDDIALSLAKKSVELSPDNPVLRFRLAEVQLKSGMYREVLRTLNHCNGKMIEKGSVHLLKVQTYIGLGQTVKAKKWAQEVLFKYPLSSSYYKEAEELYRTLQ
ncbi:lipopolysaccharide assembly protein LapB [Desulfopila sp. IMCC35008]|uniref:tetratricopeptide repeat protein n=1 Tax=Desulfopila sp. IMCC35008 TaxID=2653858 RepID=UPI0013D7A0D9|nr:tetratricopeptide repeat protein [Desulfopila sp. IMCC35008]